MAGFVKCHISVSCGLFLDSVWFTSRHKGPNRYSRIIDTYLPHSSVLADFCLLAYKFSARHFYSTDETTSPHELNLGG